MAAIQTQKKAMSWQKSEGSIIAEYNDQFMILSRVSEACGGTFQLPEVIDILLKEKHNGFAFNELDSTATKALNNKVCGRVLAVIFIENISRRIYYELVKTIENDYLMGQDNYPRYMVTIQKLLVNYKHT